MGKVVIDLSTLDVDAETEMAYPLEVSGRMKTVSGDVSIFIQRVVLYIFFYFAVHATVFYPTCLTVSRDCHFSLVMVDPFFISFRTCTLIVF